MEKRKVIIVTDGDMVAKGAVEVAASNIGGRCISASAGNPTPITGTEVIDQVKKAVYDPVVVMTDDRGLKGEGPGEAVMEEILRDESMEVLGIVAVSSNGRDCNGLNVTCSVTKNGEVVDGGVDKYGNNLHTNYICGDTLSILKNKRDMVIVGIGDPGKMDFNDEVLKGAPITTKALQEVMKRSGYKH